METVALTEREKLVIRYLTLGLNNGEISNILHISVHTTKAHLESIYEKFKVHNRVQASMKAVQMGLVELQENINKE